MRNPATHLSCVACGHEFRDSTAVVYEPHPFLASTNDDWVRVLHDCTLLGGCGVPLRLNGASKLRFSSAGMEVVGPTDEAVPIAWGELTAVNISGPGKVTSGGGFIGGGFGVEGALIGIGVGSLLNALTTRTKVFTFLQIETVDGEAFFHYGGMEPSALRIELSPVFVAMRSAPHYQRSP